MTVRLHRVANLVQSVLLLLLLFGLLWLLASWVLPDARLALSALGLAAIVSLMMPAWAGNLLLRRLGARAINERDTPGLTGLVAELARRARLRRSPRLFLVPSAVPNAFAARALGGPVIALTVGLLQRLNGIELAAVLAHEIGHVRNRDLFVLAFADLMVRLTRLLSSLGKILLLLVILMAVLEGARVPWFVALCLIVAPAVAEALRLALSRAREFDADFEAARLTGRPEALASALRRLEEPRPRLWRRLLLGDGSRVPSYRRTHPSTAARVDRLARLQLQPEWKALETRWINPFWAEPQPARPLPLWRRLLQI